MHNQPLRFRPQRKIKTLFYSDKESLRGRYRKLTAAQLDRMARWADSA